MRYSIIDGDISGVSTPCLVTDLRTARKVARAQGEIKHFTKTSQDFEDTAGDVVVVNLNGSVARILVVGGMTGTLEQATFRKLCKSAMTALLKLPIKQAVVALDSASVKGGGSAWKLRCAAAALSHLSYRYNTHKSKPAKPPSLANARLWVKAKTGLNQQARLANALDAGLRVAKDLGNEPPNICNPTYVLQQARKLGRQANVKVSSLSEKKMAELGMGAFLAVSQGSDTPGHMIIIEYSGGKKSDRPIALVGKGITFDTGGISLKPPGGMDEMKFDMCGAAAVIGATRAAIDAKLPINLITVVAAAENMPSGNATRPADIVTSASGQTIEILNTDAEGRLVLCDALTHVQKFKPKAIVDVATLTGACIVALGSHASAVYANDESLAQELLSAGEQSGDRAWRMPLWDEYQAQLNSNFADMANVGGRNAGSVTAACFLKRFIDDVPWAHMDVAGSAFQGGAQKGSTGRPVPLLFNYLVNQSTK
ncbi:MAG: leucyl aminopeptidase [Pseudomonadota bacterium]